MTNISIEEAPYIIRIRSVDDIPNETSVGPLAGVKFDVLTE